MFKKKKKKAGEGNGNRNENPSRESMAWLVTVQSEHDNCRYSEQASPNITFPGREKGVFFPFNKLQQEVLNVFQGKTQLAEGRFSDR